VSSLIHGILDDFLGMFVPPVGKSLLKRSFVQLAGDEAECHTYSGKYIVRIKK